MSRKVASWRGCAVLLLLLWSVLALGDPSVSIVPVASARQGNDWYRTHLVLRSLSGKGADCEAAYSIPNDANNGTIRADLPVGSSPRVERDVLSEIGAIGTLRVQCSDAVEVAAVIERAADGNTFRPGWVFKGLGESPASRAGARVSIAPLHDLVVAEVSGQPVVVDAVIRGEHGAVLARRQYAIPAFAQQIVNLSEVREVASGFSVELSVTAGDGAVVAGDESRDPAITAALVPRASPRTAPDAAVAAAAQVANLRAADAIRDVGAASFKAAPFHDPATGLVYLRNRWYDPTVGAFLSPDPLGYRDSSNLYSYCGGDPVNCEDPTGEQAAVQVRPPPRPAVRPPAPGARGRVPELVRPGQNVPRYAPGDWLAFRQSFELSAAARPKGAGARVFGGRTVEELTEPEKTDFLAHRRRIFEDRGYRERWNALERGRVEILPYLIPPLAGQGGAGGGDDGDGTTLTPWGVRSTSTGKFVGGARAGVDPVDQFIHEAEAHGFDVLGREISVRTPFETRRVDVVLRSRSTGAVGAVELKSSRAEFRKLKKEQFAADRYINMHGAVAVGQNARQAQVQRIDSIMKVLWEPR